MSMETRVKPRKTVQMDPRSPFVPEASQAALGKAQTKEMERKHRKGYLRRPVRRGEFSVWEAEQVWSD